MTAEGDNSVLMQKVAKERLGILAKQPLQAGFRIRTRIRMDPH
jgi:hypothetical protein